MNLQENIQRIREVMGVEKKSINEQSWDDAVDVIAGALDGVPGIGNLLSMGIDLGHVISYLYRYSDTTNESEKIEYGLLGLITLGMAFVPAAGNASNILYRQGIKSLLSTTPDVILKWAMKHGIINPRLLLGKGIWKYSLLLLFVRVFKDEASEVMTDIINTLNDIRNGVKDYTYLPGVSTLISSTTELTNLLKELKPHVKTAQDIVDKCPNLDCFNS